MTNGYILCLLGLMAGTLRGAIPAGVPFIGAESGGRQPLNWVQTFSAVFLAILLASVIVAIGATVLFFILLGVVIASIEDLL